MAKKCVKKCSECSLYKGNKISGTCWYDIPEFAEAKSFGCKNFAKKVFDKETIAKKTRAAIGKNVSCWAIINPKTQTWNTFYSASDASEIPFGHVSFQFTT